VLVLDDEWLVGLVCVFEVMLGVFIDDLFIGELMCWLCDELVCFDECCLVECVELVFLLCCGLGYGVLCVGGEG